MEAPIVAPRARGRLANMSDPQTPYLQSIVAQKVAYIAVRGSYELLPGKMVELATWFGRQAMELGGHPGATYYNSPGHADENELEWEVWIPTSSSLRERDSIGGRIGVKTLASATCATLVHVGPYETLDRSSDALLRWAAKQGHLPAGPFQTVFVDDPADVDGRELRTVVRFAVTPRDPAAEGAEDI